MHPELYRFSLARLVNFRKSLPPSLQMGKPLITNCLYILIASSANKTTRSDDAHPNKQRHEARPDGEPG